MFQKYDPQAIELATLAIKSEQQDWITSLMSNLYCMVKFTVVVMPVETVVAFDCVVNPVFETVMV